MHIQNKRPFLFLSGFAPGIGVPVPGLGRLLNPLKILLLILCSTLSVSVFAANADAYLLKEGDVVSISVWGEDTLNQQTLVLPDGSISFPLVGNINVRGMSAPDIERAITDGLQEYIPEADVSVVVVNTQGNRIYVLGRVNNPGTIEMAGPMSVVQALSLSAGLDTFADASKIRILRKSGERQTQLEVRYNDILSGKDLSTNYQLEAGDTILVP